MFSVRPNPRYTPGGTENFWVSTTSWSGSTPSSGVKGGTQGGEVSTRGELAKMRAAKTEQKTGFYCIKS